MHRTKQRKAFSILTAIFIMLIMAALSLIVMSLAGKISKQTTQQYQREQAMLLAKSYTEYAIMAVMANDRNSTASCLSTINSDNVINPENNGGYQVRVQIAYISNGTGEVSSCNSTDILSDAVTTTKSALNVMIDVYVQFQDIDNSTQVRTFHKRTLQKI